MKRSLLLLLLVSSATFGQQLPTTSCSYDSDATRCLFTAGAPVLPGQLVKATAVGAAAYVVPISTTDGTAVALVGVSETTVQQGGFSVRVRTSGMGPILVDGPCVVGNSLIESTILPGYSHCAPAGGGFGIAFTASSGSGTITAFISDFSAGAGGVGSRNVASVFGRTGAVIAQNGDYSFSQLSGTANLATQASGVLPSSNVGPINLGTSGNGGVTGILPLPQGGTSTSNAPIKRMVLAYSGCNAGVAGPAWDLPTSGAAVATCKTDVTNGTVQGTLAFADAQVAYYTTILPPDWASFGNAVLDFTTSDTTNGHTIIFALSAACTAPNAGTADTPAYNTAQTATTTIGVSAVANALYQVTINMGAAGATTGCTAGSILHLKLARNTDTDTDTAVAATGNLILPYNGTYQ